MLSSTDLERLITEKRREIDVEKSTLGLSPPSTVGVHIEDLENGSGKPEDLRLKKRLRFPDERLEANKVGISHKDNTREHQETNTQDEIPAGLDRYIRRYLGLPVMLKAGEFSPNNPILREERTSGDVLLGLGEYERRRNTLRKIRQQQYREYLDQQAKKKQEDKEQAERIRRELEEKERLKEEERARLRQELEKDRATPEQRRASVCYVDANARANNVGRSVTEAGIQVNVTNPLSVAVQTDDALYTLSQKCLTTAERELSPRTVGDKRDQGGHWDDRRPDWGQNRDHWNTNDIPSMNNNKRGLNKLVEERLKCLYGSTYRWNSVSNIMYSKLPSVYFGHPFPFWRERLREKMKIPVNVGEMKKLGDLAEYDSVHIQKFIVNRVSEKVQLLLDNEEMNLSQRREKLRLLLQKEEEEFMQELATRRDMEECGYCKEKKKSLRDYEEEIEREKVRECQKALEREKIAKGRQNTKQNEIKLKEMQKLQMEEKRRIEEEQARVESMWHQVMLHEVTQKENQERMQLLKRQQDMKERRKEYDDQIASANRKRREHMQRERESENARLEIMNKQMREDYYQALRRKKEQQSMNSRNFIEGHRVKEAQALEEMVRDQLVDRNAVVVALEELRRDNLKKVAKMHNLRREQQVTMDFQRKEREMSSALLQQAHEASDEMRRSQEILADHRARIEEVAQNAERKKAQEKYKSHLQKVLEESEREKQEKITKMHRVRSTSMKELQAKLESANLELRKQMEYRKCLDKQISDNLKISTMQESNL